MRTVRTHKKKKCPTPQTPPKFFSNSTRFRSPSPPLNRTQEHLNHRPRQNGGRKVFLIDIIKSLPEGPGWGPSVTTETMLNGVPYAPYSKGDKLGKMADWTTDKDGRDGRGGRAQYNRNYRGMLSSDLLALSFSPSSPCCLRGAPSQDVSMN